MTALRIPPGRAGRLWLRRRLDLAERGVALLDRKLALLEPEARRRTVLRDDTAREWEAACAHARTWQLRAALLGGRRAPRSVAVPAADITVRTAAIAGVRYPCGVDCRLPQNLPNNPDESATLLSARAAHREALSAAATHAAARAAAHALERELAATRIRVRALRHHRIPALRTALAQLEFALEEQERADLVRLTWAGRKPAASDSSREREVAATESIQSEYEQGQADQRQGQHRRVGDALHGNPRQGMER
ncbi:V-type ATP synthase subunit D [Nocardia sp. NBC_01503]|uniref:V-type ATP synthase subunit D n=1 Tax=Nocardia sp. NBC_01503 TaxID=2975997 RepID=UPI002E7B11B1|nr:V-type ATP synthase subunit D [Nocardia sp. NBC_01503]WTL30628.1 V-type ATP synthase subunit D [Nocardia sp. NBC_01503]